MKKYAWYRKRLHYGNVRVKNAEDVRDMGQVGELCFSTTGYLHAGKAAAHLRVTLSVLQIPTSIVYCTNCSNKGDKLRRIPPGYSVVASFKMSREDGVGRGRIRGLISLSGGRRLFVALPRINEGLGSRILGSCLNLPALVGEPIPEFRDE
jgi:hypothetical protein